MRSAETGKWKSETGKAKFESGNWKFENRNSKREGLPSLVKRGSRGGGLRLALLLAVALLLSHTTSAQVATGFPPYGSFGGGPFDTVNKANLNVHFAIPIISKAGRGLPFDYAVTYDSSIWSPVSSTGQHTWTPVGQSAGTSSTWGWGAMSQAMVGYVSYYLTQPTCNDHNGQVYYYEVLSSWSYYDAQGTGHAFPSTLQVSNLSLTPCTNNHNPPYYSGSATATDGSGWQISVSAGPLGMPPQPSATEYSVSGVTIVAPFSPGGPAADSVTDPNGNVIIYSGGGITDTLGTTVLTVQSGNPSSYTWTPQGSSTGTVTFKYTLQTVQTYFGCSGISEYGATPIYLVSEIDMPDVQSVPTDKYTISYETTPGHSPNVTGRIASITLPTGGKITYQYSGGSGGITCADGSTATLTRKVYPDGVTSQVWTYAHSESGTAWTTTIADPQSNQTVMNFQTIYETQRVVKQGSSTVLGTVNTCYNSSATSCNSTAVSRPITQRTVTTTLGNLKAQTQTFYNSYGMPTKVDEYDFGSGTVGNFKRETMACYASLSWIQDRPSAKVVYSTNTGNPSDCSGTSNLVAKTTYAYDSNGNLQTEKRYYASGSSSYISRSFTYGSYGVLTSSTDFKGNSTGYSNFTCATNTAFPTTITLPITSLTYTLNWNCDGGVLTSIQDPNGQPTTDQYGDATFWRITEIDYPDLPTHGKTTIQYSDSQPFSVSTCRYLDSSVCHQTTQVLDGLGRVAHSQDITAGTYVDTTYDTLGRVYTVSNPYYTTSDKTYGLTTYGYDALGRVTSVQAPDGSTTSTSFAAGSSTYCSTVTDPAGKVRKLCSDGLGRVTAVTEDPSSLNYQTTYTYNLLDNLTGVNQGSQTRTYNYDMLARLTGAQTPEAGTTTYSYAVSGNPCSGDPSAPCTRTDARNITTTYTYNDPLNRLTSKTYSDSTPPATFSYDQTSVTVGSWTSPTLLYPKGRMTEATTTSSGTLQTAVVYSYDPVGRISDFWQCSTASGSCGSRIADTHYNYDLAGDVSSWVHPGQFTLTNTVNAAQQVTAVQTSAYGTNAPQYLATSISYTPWGAVSTLQNGCVGSGCANAQESYQYNKRLQPWVNSLTGGSNTGYCLVYNYYTGSWTPPSSCPSAGSTPPAGTTDNGNVMGYWYQDISTSSLNHTATNSYDNANRLSTAVATGNFTYNLTFAFNTDGSTGQFGNMTCVTNAQTNGPCPNWTYTAGTNQISTSSGFTYDAAGNVTADGLHTYQWDAEGHPITIDSGSNQVSNIFNALGRRAYWSKGSGTVTYWDDPWGQFLGGYWSPGSFNAEIPFAGRMLAEYTSGTTGPVYFDHPNALGSEGQWTTVAGGYNGEVQFYPWGQVAAGTANGFQVYASLLWYDTGNDGYQTPNRYYIPRHSRWLTPDPVAGDITNPQSLNLYAYVLNNPTSFTDSLGLFLPMCDPSVDPGCGGGWGGGGWGGGGGGWGGGFGPSTQVCPDPLNPACFTIYLPIPPPNFGGGRGSGGGSAAGCGTGTLGFQAPFQEPYPTPNPIWNRFLCTVCTTGCKVDLSADALKCGLVAGVAGAATSVIPGSVWIRIGLQGVAKVATNAAINECSESAKAKFNACMGDCLNNQCRGTVQVTMPFF